MAGLKFYDDTVRESLMELADRERHARLWRGLEPGRTSDPCECLLAMFEDSGLRRALDAGAAYGEPVDAVLRQIDLLSGELDLSRSLDDLERDKSFSHCCELATDAINALEGRPFGTVRGQPLDPL